jgi:5'-methylthioadenosine phosphorylase
VTEPTAEVGVFGGSGFYAFLDDATTHEIDTPYGPPSAPLTVGTIGERRVVFLPRHGRQHELPPHRVNYRANVWALRHLGVGAVIAPCAAGSLQPHVRPGDFVVLDQLVDRTHSRPDTYFEGPAVTHISFADPYDPDLAALAVAAARAEGIGVHERGTIVVIQGPRFSTRAESRWFRAQGWETVGMTQYPEIVLVRELGMRACGIALVTDYDTGVEGVEGIEPVTQEQVLAALDENVHHVRALLVRMIAGIPAELCRPADPVGPVGPVPR